jgi:hypothetical protein
VPAIHSRLVFPPLPQQAVEEQAVQEPPALKEAEMAWFPGIPENRPAAGNAVVITPLTTMEEATKFRTRGVLLVARDRPQNIDITIGDVTRVVVGCIRMPPHEMCTTRHRPEDFLIMFDQPHQRTLALRAGTVRVKGVFFNIIPWIEHAHGRDITWWYHVRMAIENLPVHAWNLEVLKEALGEFCLFDKIDRATYRQQASDTLYRQQASDHGTGQAPLAAGGSQQPRDVPSPPRGKSYDLLIHLDLVEDWRPP